MEEEVDDSNAEASLVLLDPDEVDSEVVIKSSPPSQSPPTTSIKSTNLKEIKPEPIQAFELNEKQKADIKEAFDLLDYDKRGYILLRDLKGAMRAMGFEPRKNEIKTMTDKLDKKNMGKISYDLFVSLMTSKLAEIDSKQEIIKAFKLFDRDSVGKISFQNLQQIAAELGEDLTDEDITEMIEEADVDGDGMVSCDEFFRIMKKTSLY